MDDVIHECMLVPNPEYLRDQFAMAALTGLLSNERLKVSSSDELARYIYAMADDMLKARKTGGRP